MKYRTTDSNQAFLAEEKPVFLHLKILNVSSTVLSYVWAGQCPVATGFMIDLDRQWPSL